MRSTSNGKLERIVRDFAYIRCMARGHLVLAVAFSIGLLHCPAVAQRVKYPVLQEEPRCGRHEIGVNLFSWIKTNNAGHYGSDQFFLNGLQYKLHCGKNAWRVGVDLFPKRYVFGASLGPGGDYPTPHSYQAGSVRDARFRVGFQRSFGKGKVKPFAGMDVGFRYITEEYDFEGAADFVYNPSWGTIRKTTEQPFVAPLVGINYRPTEHWSVTVEATFYAISSRSKTERTERSYIYPEERTHSYSQNENRLLLDPLRMVAVSYHF